MAHKRVHKCSSEKSSMINALVDGNEPAKNLIFGLLLFFYCCCSFFQRLLVCRLYFFIIIELMFSLPFHGSIFYLQTHRNRLCLWWVFVCVCMRALLLCTFASISFFVTREWCHWCRWFSFHIFYASCLNTHRKNTIFIINMRSHFFPGSFVFYGVRTILYLLLIQQYCWLLH